MSHDDLPSVAAFQLAWNQLRTEVAGSEVRGPLDLAADLAGRDHPTHLQHAITAQREATARATLDRDIQALPREDPRRESWTCCDSFSSAWVSSWPSAWRGWALSPREFREVFNTYLGLPAPCVRALAGQEIQRSGLTQRFCDQYGQQLCLATLPGDSFRARHDAIATVVIGDVLRAGIPGCREPKTLFTHILPQPVLERKAHCGIIPDARLRVPELAPPLAGGPRPSRYCNPDYLFDVKTISAAGPCYRSAAAASMANGRPVDVRAMQVAGEYETSAKRLDHQHHSSDDGPVLAALRGYPPVRGLVVGAYGEASADVHALLKLTAAKKAETAFKEMGSRTPIEAEATLTLSLRRHWGLTFVREYARMRLARVCFVGAPRCIRTAQAFSSSHCAHDDHSVFSVHALHARLRAH